MNIYVGNLSFRTTEDQLRELFAEFGDVDSASIISDRQTGRSKGFGFVIMPNSDQAEMAMNELNGKEFEGRALKVNEARERTDSGGGGSRRY